MRRRIASGACAAALLALALAACGYHIVGMGGRLPGGVTRVEVPIFENLTVRGDIGRLLTEDVIKELLASGKVQVVGAEEAQAVIRATVTTYKRDPITFDAKQKPLENRITIVMDAALVARPDERQLFTERNVVSRFDYPVTSNLQASDREEEQALRDAAKQMSQKLVSLMLEGF